MFCWNRFPSTAVILAMQFLAAEVTQTTARSIRSRTRPLFPKKQLSEDSCLLHISTKCIVHGSNAGAEDCESFQMPLLEIEPCRQTPFRVVFLYNGGDCSQSDREEVNFTCLDGSTGNPTFANEASYIVVTDSGEEAGTIYHEDWVRVGTEFVLAAPEGTSLENGFRIRIYDDANKETLLQEVVYTNGLCTNPSELLNRFGASQIVGFENEDQGLVSPFATESYSVELLISINVVGQSSEIQMKSLSFLTSFSGFVELDPSVHNKMLTTDSGITIAMPLDVDLTETLQHSVLTQVSARHSRSREGHCRAVSFDQFTTGGVQIE